MLGEDCVTGDLYREVRTRPGVLTTDVSGTAVAPNYPGEVFTFEVTADRDHRYFNMISMPYPSNDMLVAFESPGVALLEPGGAPRADAAIAADVASRLYVWDTGTEANEAGSGGYHNVPSQNDLGMQDWGPSGGDGTVRAEPDPVFSYPAVDELVRVTITPVRG